MNAARPQPAAWVPVRVQVGDGQPVHHLGDVYLDGESNTEAVAEFFRDLADRLDPRALDADAARPS